MSEENKPVLSGQDIIRTLKPAGGRTDLFYSEYPRDTKNGCIGHLRGDYGKSGKEFWTTWWPHETDLKTEHFRAEFDRMMHLLRSETIKDYDTMRALCSRHPEALIDSTWSDTEYGFTLEGDLYLFGLRCICRKGDYNFYIFCFDKAEYALCKGGVG